MTTTQSRSEAPTQNESHNSFLITSKASVESPATSWASNKGSRRRRAGKSKKEPAEDGAFDKLHYYSPHFAKLLNPAQPDVTAAVLLTNLAYWQNSRYGVKKIDGRSYAYRSLTELTEDCPYLKKTCIRKALLRMEAAFGPDFIVKRDRDVLHFSIAQKMMTLLTAKRKTRKDKEDEKTLKFSFSPRDAKVLQNVRSAVILGNLRYQIAEFTEPLKDDRDNIYGELRPSSLSRILGFSDDTISRSLVELCSTGHLIRHVDEMTFYAFGEGFRIGNIADNASAEVPSFSAEVHTPTAEVHRDAAKVHSDGLQNASQTIEKQWPPKAILPRYINGCVNEDVNEGIKDRDLTRQAMLPRHHSSTSTGLALFRELSEAKLAKMRASKNCHSSDVMIHEDELPYDIITYDCMTASERVKENVDFMVDAFASYDQKLTADDKKKFGRIFTDNPHLEGSDLYELYAEMRSGPLAWVSKTEMVKHAPGILTKVKTAKGFLRYLPQIIKLLEWDGCSEFEHIDVDDHLSDLNYAYLGRAPKSTVVNLDDGRVDIEILVA